MFLYSEKEARKFLGVVDILHIVSMYSDWPSNMKTPEILYNETVEEIFTSGKQILENDSMWKNIPEEIKPFKLGSNMKRDDLKSNLEKTLNECSQILEKTKK